jgi:hypothetical protein
VVVDDITSPADVVEGGCVMGDLQDRVRAEMESRQVKAPEVMRPSGMSPSSLTKWLRGDARPGTELAKVVSVAFGWPLAWPDLPAGELVLDVDRVDLILQALERLAALLAEVQASQVRVEARLDTRSTR